MDAAWAPIANAVMAPVLDTQARAELGKLVPNDPALAPSGSSAYSGWWSYVQKDLRSTLGRPVSGAFGTRFCGAGDAARCAASLWSALDTATAQLEATQGPEASAWHADATAERISFAPGILARTMRGSNKPTFQQAVTFRSHR
jgi:hypothetical protein